MERALILHKRCMEDGALQVGNSEVLIRQYDY